jgi:hypothetical protein
VHPLHRHEGRGADDAEVFDGDDGAACWIELLRAESSRRSVADLTIDSPTSAVEPRAYYLDRGAFGGLREAM